MSGIVVGIDGSHNASHALEWAMKEAALRKAPLTVLTVNAVTASYWTGNPVTVPADEERIIKIRKLAEDAVAGTAQARQRAADLGNGHRGAWLRGPVADRRVGRR
jgi:nucleotide-binding universal stress UspA family protein